MKKKKIYNGKILGLSVYEGIIEGVKSEESPVDESVKDIETITKIKREIVLC